MLRTYSVHLWKKEPCLHEFLDKPDTPLDFQEPTPWYGVLNLHKPEVMWFLEIIFMIFIWLAVNSTTLEDYKNVCVWAW